ncbi:MAG: alcohol dehydrogenase [Candidatus Saccharibacteria bacterium]|nr:alcohol dehydrogenase [Candidatus Saccharibacteria bacterium]
MIEAKARAVFSHDGKYQPTTINRRDVGPRDVLIEIKFAGICHSDIHTVRQEWSDNIQYPLTPGHEIAGIVTEVGSDVTTHKPGDRVGVGCMVDSCGKCEYCLRGEQQFCVDGSVSTYNGIDRFENNTPTQGGYSSHIVVKENFVLHIPDSIPLDKAAPLLCAGITTYSPLHHWHAGPDTKVAVVGLGGLGHMAVKFAHALGAEVTVLSHSDKKREDAAKFGADHYYDTSVDGTLEGLAKSFDLIINTVSSANIDINGYLKSLKVDGTMVNVGAPAEPVSVNVFALIGGRKSYAGSPIGGIKETQEMLDFSAEHGITPEIETITADEIDDAYDRVLKSDVRYRFVIDNSTL